MTADIEIRRGVTRYRSRANVPCLRIHYTADPERDPQTPRGRAWYREAGNAIVGGYASSVWRQEQEIDWEATGGELVFPQLSIYKPQIRCAPFDVPETWRLFGSFDYGHRNPSAFYIHAIDYDRNPWTIWEYYEAGAGYKEQARAIRACPYFDRLSYLPVADPSLWGETQQTDNDVKSVAQLFFELSPEERVVFAKGKAGGDVTFAEKVNGDLWYVPTNPAPDWKFRPRWRIFPTCPKLIWELEKIRYQDWGATQQMTHNQREKIVDRDNHGFDSCKYFFTMFFFGPQRPENEKNAALKKSDPTAYEEWRRVEDMFKPKDEMHTLFGG